MIVTPLKAVLYRNIFSESPPIANELIPPNSKWTAWARPRRTEKWSMQHDDVYVCTDDGQLLFLSIDRSGHFTITSVDMVGTNFDTAFAILDVSAHAPSGDILLAAGSLGDGALFIAPARKSVKVIQRLANWAPSLDCLTLESSVPDLRWDGEAYRLMPGTRLLTCSGNGHDRGAVIELRHGIEAKIGLVIEREPVFVPNIYVMPEIANWGLYVLFAEPLYSTLLYIPRSGDEAQAVEGESLGFDLEARTLAAGFTPEGMLVQITERAVNLSLDEQHRTRKEVDPSSKILLAAIDGPTEGIATASKQGETYSVEMFAIITVDGSPALINTMARQLPAGDEPICLTIGKVSRLLCIFVGTADGRVVAIMPTEVSGHSATTGITLPDSEEMGGINSLLLLQSRIRNEEETIILCGLRNGWVVPFVIVPSYTTNPELRNDMQQPSALAFKQLAPWKFGSTAASLSSASSNPASAVVACGPGLWHMQRVAQGEWPVLDVHPIWLTDQHTPAFTQPEVVTTTFISFPRDLNDAIYDSLNGSVALCTPNQFMICTLSPNSKPVPRTIFLPGSPQKMIYSKHLKALLVASIVDERVTDMKHVFSRSHPQIDLIDPDTSYPNPFSSKGDASSQLVPTAAPKPRGAAGERITAMMEWTFLFGTKPHTFIVIATQRPFLQRPEDRERGYLHFLPAKRNAQFPNGLDCTVKHRLAFDRPIRAMCSYKEHGFILCYGNVVRIIVLDQETRHFRPSPEFVLESEATSVSVRGAFVDVVTKRTSLLVLTESEDEPEKLKLFGQSGSDSKDEELRR
ncbi:hypothetical protein KEM55_003869 [Ascosphaera atra]|nr:hypothetical protein KEM55_003869 [Ascosphaera atra]